MESKKTLHSLFEDQVRAKPRHLAAIFGKRKLTYSQLNIKANQLAHYLIENGLQNEQAVAFCLDRSLEVLVCMMGVMKAGGAYLPIDAAHPQERLLYILQDSNTPILITQSEHKHLFAEYPGKVILLDKEAKKISKQSKNNPNASSDSENLAYVIYTSGSTGKPKGVLIQHKGVSNYCKWFADFCSAKITDRIDFSSNHIFDMAVTSTINSLVNGLTIVIASDDIKMNPSLYLKYVKNFKLDIIKVTPSYFKVLIQEIRSKSIRLPHLRAIIMGGEAASAADCKSWLCSYPKHTIFNEYGPSEASVAISVFAMSRANMSQISTNVPIGTVGPNMHFTILDNELKSVAPGETGELYVGGVCLGRGYLNLPEMNAKCFITDPTNSKRRLYKTGDLCRLLANGDLDYIGRIDHQVKIRGFRIEPGEVEKHLIAHPDIKSAVVVAQKDFAGENQLVGYYILNDIHKNLSKKQLRGYLQKHVPIYMVPTAFVSVDSIPLTSGGKLDKSALPMPQLSINHNFQEPITSLEKSLARIWSKELGITNIGLEDDFFELGGHSLSAGRVISMINSFFGKNINLRNFYEAPTIGQLARVIEKAKGSKRSRLSPSQKWLKKIDDIPLSDFQFLLWMGHTFESKVKKLNITARKRIQGHLHKESLEFSLLNLIKRQEVFNYYIFKFSPAQMLVKKQSSMIIAESLESLSIEEYEQRLNHSIGQLNAYHKWTKETPLIRVLLFYLPDNQCEIQIAMPHFITDDVSPEIVLKELSKNYQLHQGNNKSYTINVNHVFREYVYREQFYYKTDLDKDIKFWDRYLSNASMLAMPSSVIIKNMHEHKLNYSTFVPIPSQNLEKLKEYCAEQHFSIIDGLIGFLGLALIKIGCTTKQETSHILINLVKSTRDNVMYDDTVGCFLRVEPVKILLDQKATLYTLASQIHKSVIETSLHQRCPGIIKLASTYTVRKKNNPILNIIIKSLASIYALIVKAPQIYRKIFNVGGVRLAQFKPHNNFLININIQNDFITDSNQDKSDLFGEKTLSIKSDVHDVLKINNVLDISFVRRDDNNQAFLVVSANLDPGFREMIAQEMISNMAVINEYESSAESSLTI